MKEDIGAYYDKLEQLWNSPPVRAKAYLLACQEGIELAKKYPEGRMTIGYHMTSLSAYVRFGEILNLTLDLWQPRDITDHKRYDEDWLQFEQLVQDMRQELSEDFGAAA
jgi:hypothetical protein